MSMSQEEGLVNFGLLGSLSWWDGFHELLFLRAFSLGKKGEKFLNPRFPPRAPGLVNSLECPRASLSPLFGPDALIGGAREQLNRNICLNHFVLIEACLGWTFWSRA